ncbi:hypothetical protein M408DRAFT_328319 [Serendipita vermifera MAFF 305830]|uniref:Uncharacterized protein n=1 Tax=Serendipita vermifera MAFF 305830 TaxID=933852 RepID=A0A0C3BFP0_SERVB|nr:hypothetical protein M408DRAFT_328319 [Serendipita vermifera MAFF 305830]
MGGMGNNIGSTILPWLVTHSPIVAPIYQSRLNDLPWDDNGPYLPGHRPLVYSSATVKSTTCHRSSRFPPVSEQRQGVQPD